MLSPTEELFHWKQSSSQELFVVVTSALPHSPSPAWPWVGGLEPNMELRSLPGCHPHHRVDLMQGRRRKDHPCASLSQFKCLSTNLLVVRCQKGAAEQGGGSEGVGTMTNT